MQFSQTIEYALRAMVWLAGHSDAPQTTAQIAEGTQVPGSYLSKVLQALGRAGLVQGQRGVGGGFVLTRPASKINILEVVQAVEPFERIHSCPLKLEAHATALCPLHHHLDEALAHIEASFRSTNLSDLVDEDQELTKLCPAASLVGR